MNRPMTRRGCRHVGLVLAAVVLIPALGRAQTVQGGSGLPVPVTIQTQPPRDRPPEPPRVGTAVIKGTVVDGVTGNPIARARVRLLNNPAQKPAVLTDALGAFAFTALPTASYSVMVEKSTYLAGRYPDTTQSLRAGARLLLLRDGQAAQISIAMFRGGAIAGRVLDAHGDPIDMAQVRVLRAPRGRPPTTAGQAQTNDLGEYRVPRLQPGGYVLQVRPSMQSQNFAPDPSVIEAPLPQPLPTYYPNAQALSQARAITVGRGETISGVDMMLAEGVPTLVTGTVLRSDGEAVGGGSVNTRFTGPEATFGFDSGGATGIRPGGAFRLTLPPGEYIFEAQVLARQGVSVGPNEQLFGSSRVTVGGAPIEDVTIMVGKGATATGKIVFEGTSPLPPPSPGQARVLFYNPSGPGCRPTELTVAADWSFKIEGLNGTCGAQPSSVFGRWMLKSLTIRGLNLLDQLMTFETGQHYNNVQIVLTDKRPAMDLRVTGDDGQPTREYVGVAFPVDKEKWASPLRPVRWYVPTQATTPIETTGRITTGVPPGSVQAATGMPQAQFQGLPPGEYYVIAVDDLTAEEAQDPGVLERLAASASRVTLSDEAPLEVPLRRFTFADLMR